MRGAAASLRKHTSNCLTKPRRGHGLRKTIAMYFPGGNRTVDQRIKKVVHRTLSDAEPLRTAPLNT